ncbi:hypothetical protein BOTBODRAFT_68038 [Botryobasidium botryosum FD-172 SS1]|uniref:Glucose receptor Git3 N-terminal domain-containing protein n=1 Tax=Botryobasidium botryosum (strain FD-172 SS1) TaxID=930990 RepID=A0A067M6G7_BOTB1|nr:hypothetical protein BOTBODRAFT_68038 [Botryobasidium botryosum FD-172 SS1]
MIPGDSCDNPLGTGQIVGLAFVVEAGFLSLSAILCLTVLVIRKVIILKKSPFQRHVDIYIACLFFTEAVQALGQIFDLRWVLLEKVQCGAHCAAQGSLQEWGEAGVAMSTLVITIHTFFTLFFHWSPSPSKLLPILVVAFIWTYNLLFVTIGYAVNPKARVGNDEPYYVATPYWCWIYSSKADRIFGEYIWIWTAMIASIILYILLFLFLRGNLLVAPSGKWFRVRFVLRPGAKDENTSDGLSFRKPSEAMKMLCYPTAYTIVVLPSTIYRWVPTSADLNVRPQDEPFGSTGFCAVVFALSGFINVVLFVLTRPSLLLLGDDDTSGGATIVHTRNRSLSISTGAARPGSAAAQARTGPVLLLSTRRDPHSHRRSHSHTHTRSASEDSMSKDLFVGPESEHRRPSTVLSDSNRNSNDPGGTGYDYDTDASVLDKYASGANASSATLESVVPEPPPGVVVVTRHQISTTDSPPRASPLSLLSPHSPHPPHPPYSPYSLHSPHPLHSHSPHSLHSGHHGIAHPPFTSTVVGRREDDSERPW